MIPAGTFTMGSSKVFFCRPAHEVQLDAFYMMTTEVTQSTYDAFMKSSRLRGRQNKDLPITGVNRKSIDKLITWLNSRSAVKYSLPSEAQWEYAARSGKEGFDYPWGNELRLDLANIGYDNSKIGYHLKAVKSYPPNDYGLYDMCGNAGEIVYEGDYSYSNSKQVNPIGKAPTGSDLMLSRGLGAGELFPQVWYRSNETQEVVARNIGFRLVATGIPH